MRETLLLSRSKLETFHICRRRFQLRYLEKMPWPARPLAPEQETAVARGQHFHRLLERHFLDMDVSLDTVGEDDQLRRWWEAFLTGRPRLPQGTPLPELRLTVPVEDVLLTGRFDLLIVGQDAERPFAHIYDWKTSRPRPVAQLRDDWQTRLYLAMLAESGQALLPADAPAFNPADLAITYWYVSEPEAPRTIRYSAAWHAENWTAICRSVAQIEAQPVDTIWPLTDDWQQCRLCTYQVICGRQAAGRASPRFDTDVEPSPPTGDLEPETP